MPRWGDNSAVVVVDVLATYEHEHAETLAEDAARTLPALQGLLSNAGEREIGVIYVNDTHDDWRSDRGLLVERALAGRHPELVEPLVPDEDTSLILKGRHSIFWETPLAYVLSGLEIGRLILCGQVTEQCILYSALDAHIRHLDVVVAQDACACIDRNLADAALDMMRRNMHARIVDAADAVAHG